MLRKNQTVRIADPTMAEPLRPIGRALYHAAVRIGFAVTSPVCRINKRPIIVLGNQKSGTTAIAALLAELTALSVTLDLTLEVLRPSYEHLRRGDMSFERFVQRNRLSFSRDIVKEPSLTVFHSQLAAYFPEARFVYVLRDPRDNIRSILNRLQLPGNLADLPPRHGSAIPLAWWQVLDGGWLGVSGDNYVGRLAARWNLLTDVYGMNHDGMRLVRYEDFRRHKTPTIAALADDLGLRCRRDITRSVDKPFQPPGDSSVSREDFFGRENLARINDICGMRMTQLGYEPDG